LSFHFKKEKRLSAMSLRSGQVFPQKQQFQTDAFADASIFFYIPIHPSDTFL